VAKLKTVLIVGGSGYVGTQIALHLKEQYKVYATYYRHYYSIPGVTFVPFDATDKDWTKRIIYSIQPQVVIYCAGSNDVEAAEENQKICDQVHGGGSVTVSGIADIYKPKFIFVSNCYVFDGKTGNYHTDETLMPVTALGKAKGNGENYIKRKAFNYLFVRCSPLIGFGNAKSLSFTDILRMRLDRGERVETLTVETHSYAHISGLLTVIERLIEGSFKNRVFHYGGLTKLNPYEFAKEFATRFGYDPQLVVPKILPQQQKLKTEGSLFDYSLNFTTTVNELKIKPLFVEESLNLLEKELVGRA
jgi:dTDP-4-dehydrorhamnose reductase